VLIVDTNVWLAAVDRRSDRHSDCSAVLRAHGRELAVPVPVIAETSWLILDRLGSRSQNEFLHMVTSGRIEPIDLEAADWARSVELTETYADMSLDLMDASIVALAEARNLTTIATLNRRDFTVVRPRHVDAFELIP
jgi:predicted nucleic acid-binding protein